MTMPTSLERIADALERIAAALEPQDAQEAPQEPQDQPTLTNPLLAWFASTAAAPGAVEDTQEPRTAQTTWEWLGITPPAIRGRQKNPVIVEVVAESGRQPGTPSHCGRCGREGTRRMNGADHCRFCQHEPFWDE